MKIVIYKPIKFIIYCLMTLFNVMCIFIWLNDASMFVEEKVCMTTVSVIGALASVLVAIFQIGIHKIHDIQD